MRTMRAAIYERCGAAHDVLRVREIERPEPGPNEVRVPLRVSGVNPTDWKSRRGTTGRAPDGFQIPNQDGAGEIDAVGAGVDTRRVGERVWVWFAAANGRRWGTAAQWTVVPARQAVTLPTDVGFDLGASLGVPAMTAHRCLFADGPLDGATVLVAGGAGAVGHDAIELAKWAGATTVVTTVSGPEKAALAYAAGADAVVNYHDADAVDQVRRVVARVDRVIEVALGANLALDLAVSGPQTVISTYANEPTDPVLPVRAAMIANVTLRFVLLYGVPPAALDAAATEVTAAVAAGALTLLPLHRFSLDDIAAAHDAVEGGAVGKVVVDLP